MRTKNLVFSVFTLLLFTSFAYAQVTGVVVDDFGPLPDAVVTVDETGVSTTTGEDGAFSIEAQVGDNLTILNPTSLSEMNVAVTGMNLGNLNMSASAIGLDDVISVGYTTFKETDITSSVSNVSSEEVEQIPIPSLDQMLQGRAAGVNVSIGSGQPGASGTITIRGSNSLQGDDEPLFIIDGVPVDTDNFRSLNMNDVADITIIKDAAGAALYGSRAAGGVVVVTTKKGNFDQKLKLQYRTQFGVSIKPTPNFDVMNSTQYLNYQNQYGIGTGAGLTPEEISQLASTNTDWTDVFLKNGYLNSHEINASVGSENFRSYTSLGYLDQDGITYRSNLQRFTFRNNAEYKKDKITVGANITSNYSKSDFVIDANRDSNTGGELDNPFIVPYIGIPYYNPYNEDGSLNTIGTIQSGALNADGTLNVSGANGFPNTPYLALNTLVMNEDQEEELRTVGNIYADYKFTDWLSAGVNFGLDYQDTERYYLDHPNSIRGQLSPSTEANLKGYRYQLRSRILDIVNTTNLTFNKTFNEKHNLTLSAFLEYNKEYRRSFGYNANGINPAFATSIGGLVSGETVEEVDGEETRPYIASIVGGSQDRGLLSYFGIMNYSFDSRYI